MRRALLPVIALAGLAGLLGAQTTATVTIQGPGAAKNPMIGFLSPEDQDRVIRAHDRALAADPRLKLEEEALKQAGPTMAYASPGDQMAFLEKVRTHQVKIRQAMLKEDPAIGPLLDEIDRHLSQERAEQEKAVEAAPAASSAPATEPGAPGPAPTSAASTNGDSAPVKK